MAKAKKKKSAKKNDNIKILARRARQIQRENSRYLYPIQAPSIAAGVVPKGEKAPVMAFDYSGQTFGSSVSFYGGLPGAGFPGFQYLAMLSTRAEFRAFATTLSTELTREWIDFTSEENDGDDSQDKIKAIRDEFDRLKVQEVIQRSAMHDCYYGRGQIFIDIDSQDRSLPLILDPRTIVKGSLKSVSTVEAVWTTPSAWNAIDPAAPDFYKPRGWFMLGQNVHASRLLTVVTRELPDILKPAFNFSGMSLSQLAEPYVDNWLRTRQSVSDLINIFSITVLKTPMSQVLQGGDDNGSLFARADLFTALRSNKGLMLLDKEYEDLMQINTPLSGLSELQSQSQEHMASVSKIPTMILTGISPTGLNASSEGEIRSFYDNIKAQQNTFWRMPIETILKVVQLSLFGEIDPRIGIKFNPLYQMTPKEIAEIREAKSRTDCAYVDHAVLGSDEIRTNLADDPESGYQGIDAEMVIEPPYDPANDPDTSPDGADDKEFKSDEQRKALFATAEGNSKIGIPQRVGKKAVKEAEKK